MRRALVPAGSLLEIQLVISLRIPPFARGHQFRLDLAALPPLLLDALHYRLGLGLLFGAMIEDGRSVLCARVHALPVFGRGVVHLEEELEEGGVGCFGRVEDYLEGFGVCFTVVVSGSFILWDEGQGRISECFGLPSQGGREGERDRKRRTYALYAPYRRPCNLGF